MAEIMTEAEANGLLKIECENWKRSYLELIYAVQTKYPNETRHETALKYIREREMQTSGTGAALNQSGSE